MIPCLKVRSNWKSFAVQLFIHLIIWIDRPHCSHLEEAFNINSICPYLLCGFYLNLWSITKQIIFEIERQLSHHDAFKSRLWLALLGLGFSPPFIRRSTCFWIDKATIFTPVFTCRLAKARKPRLMEIHWFSCLKEGADFQKWFEISKRFFRIMKIWYFEIPLALVSCHYPNWTKNHSCLKKVSKIWVLLLNKTGQFSAFSAFWKKE